MLQKNTIKKNEKETVIIDKVTTTTVEDDTHVMESDSHITEEEKEVYEIFKKKQDILAKVVKDRSDDEKRLLKHYIYKLNRIKYKKIIPDLLKKFPDLRRKKNSCREKEKTRH